MSDERDAWGFTQEEYHETARHRQRIQEEYAKRDADFFAHHGMTYEQWCFRQAAVLRAAAGLAPAFTGDPHCARCDRPASQLVSGEWLCLRCYDTARHEEETCEW